MLCISKHTCWKASTDGMCFWCSIWRKTSSQIKFDIKLLDAVNKISGKVLDQSLNINYRPPAQFTGELLGVEYLYDQSNFTLDGNADTEIDEGAEVDDGY